MGAAGEDFGAGFGDENGVLDLDGEGAVFRDDVPAIFHVLDARFASAEDRLDGDNHAGFQVKIWGVCFEIGNSGIFVEDFAHAMSGELADD